MTLKMKLWPDIAAINDTPFNFGDNLKTEHAPKLNMTPKKKEDCKIKDYPKN